MYILVCVRACVYICMFVCMYVHTCCFLIIPSSRGKHSVNLRPVEILLHKRANARAPPCNDLNNLFIFKNYEVIASCF